MVRSLRAALSVSAPIRFGTMPARCLNATRKCEIAAVQRQPIGAFARIGHLVSTFGTVRRLLHAITDLIINVLGQCSPLLMLPDPLLNMGTICDGLATA